MVKIQDKKFMSRFQISNDTGISQDYFNDILVSEPEVILEPHRYYKRGEQELKEVLVGKLGKLRTYSGGYSEDVVARANAPVRDCDGSLSYMGEPVSLDDFIGDENICRIRELDGIVTSMKELGISVEKLDLQLLMGLMYKASLLIYGTSYEEKLKRRFGFDQEIEQKRNISGWNTHGDY